MMRAMLTGFVLGVVTCIVGLILLALIGLQSEPPAFVEYAPATTSFPDDPPAMMIQTDKRPLTTEQQEAVEKAYQMIEKVERTNRSN